MNIQKRCQFCGSIISRNAQKCPRCKEWLIREECEIHQGNGKIISIIAWTLSTLIALIMIGLSDPNNPNDVTGIFAIFFFFIFGISFEIYFLPTRIALNKNHTQLFLVIALNLLLGCTAIGWLVALVVASIQRNGRNSFY